VEVSEPGRPSSDKAILDRLPVLTYASDQNGVITGAAWIESVHPDDRDRVREHWLDTVAAGVPYVAEMRLRGEDGTFCVFLNRAVPVRDASGTLKGYAGAAFDIDTGRKRREDLRTLTELHERVSIRERLYGRLSERLSEALSLDETIEVMLGAIVPDFADWMSVYLEKRERDGFEVIAMRHWDERRRPIVEELIGTTFTTESSATAQVLRTGEAMLLERYPEDLRARAIQSNYFGHLERLGLRSAIVVPFRRGERIIGAIHVIRGDNLVNFDREDLLLVEEVARRMTPAIYHAEAYERERLVARRFQEAALPTVLPDLPGLEFDAVYEAAKTEATVGGDWYDVFQIDDERLLVSVGDVAGHGLQAATIMAMLRQSLRALSLTTGSPGELMFLLRSLMAKEYPDTVATAFIGILWPSTGKLEYVSAGHPAPLVRSPSGYVEELTGGRRPLLGIPHPKSSHVAKTTLSPGSLLLLFTDGLTEATRDVLEGERHLRSVVGSAEVGSALNPAHVVYEAMLRNGSFDDTAILSVRYVGIKAALGKTAAAGEAAQPWARA